MADQELGLKPVLAGLQAFGAANPAIGNDELVDGKPFGARYLDQYAIAIDRGRLDRFGNQVVQIMEGLGADAECGELSQTFLFFTGRRQEFDKGLALALPPAPYLSVMETGDGIEFEAGEESVD